MKRLILVFCLILSSLAAFGLQINAGIDTNRWQDKALYPVDISQPGAPALPFYPIRVILPFGEKLQSAELSLSNPGTLRSGMDLDFIRQQQPVSKPSPDRTVKNLDIYNTDRAYPYVDYEVLGTQFYRGYQLAVINIYPFKYNPISRQLTAYSSFNLNLNTVYDAATAEYQASFISSDLQTLKQLQDMTINHEVISSYSSASALRNYAPKSRLIDLSTPRKMIVITDAIRAPWFTDYVAWRSSLGVSTGVFLTGDIYSEYPGVDNADKVRNFIIDAYQSWATSATPLEYVILGGDDEIVPERGAYGEVGSTVDARMPVDLYYGCLDGTWNSNNNDVWGEVSDNVDMVPEVHVGRFPAESIGEFNNIFRKIRYYVDVNSFSNNLAIMYGENLNMDPVTWGGDYKDAVAVFVPDTYNIETHYQRDGTYSEQIVWDSINQGANVMNHMGHANETFLLGQGNNTIEQLENTEFGWLYSQGCYPAAFDNRTSSDGESIGEHLLTASGALMGFIGNTRYGWYAPGSIDGASEFFDRQYFNGMYNYGTTELGKALTFCRAQNLNASLQSSVMRWCYYEQVLFGDPSIQVKFPDASMPLLSLDSYTFDDALGDNDGILNPGEIIRLHPRIKNHPDWATAYNVSIQITGLPQGSQVLGGCPVFPSIAPGQIVGDDSPISIQLPTEIGFGVYRIKLAIQSMHPQTNITTGVRVFNADFEITLLDNRFPWDCQNGSKSSPVVHDFNNDGDLDIAYLDTFGTSYLIGNDGELIGDFDSPSSENIMRSSAMGDIDGDGSADLVFASRTGRLYAQRANGSTIFSYTAPNSFLFTPVLADVDGNGNLETIAGALDGKIYVVKNDGTLLSGFPVDLGSTFQSELAAADLNNDDSFEIIAGTVAGNIYAIQNGGSILSGYPVSVGSPITGAPTVMENFRIAFGTNSRLHLVNSNGTVVFSKGISASMAGSPALADLDRNGSIDLIFVSLSGMLYAVDQSGADLPGFPVSVGVNFNCPPLVADLDADNQYEVLLHSYVNSVYIYNHDGSSVEGYPFITSYNGATPASLVDFDDNGYFKLVSGYSTGVMMVNLRRPASAMTPWVTYRGELKRQGSYAATGYVANDDASSVPEVQRLYQNYPNPFSCSTSIVYHTAKSGPVSIDIYNLKGQKIRSLGSAEKSAGSHELSWDAKDFSGRDVAAGIYIYKMNGPEGSQSKKMLLVK